MGIFTRPVERDDDNNIVAAPFNTPRPLTAAAAKINIGDKDEFEALNKRRANSEWQTHCWEYYDLIGEIKYAVRLMGAVISRIRIYGAYVTDDNMAPSPIASVESVDDELKADVARTVKLLATGPGGMGGLLSAAAKNLFVTGECYLVQQPARVGSAFSRDTWQIRSVDEVVALQDGRVQSYKIKKTRDAKKESEYIYLKPGTFVARIWNMHPRYSDEADSSMRGLIELMDELLLLNKDARATIKSRLNAGILLLPDDLSNISQIDGVTIIEGEEIQDESPDDTEDFEEELQVAMLTPISDEGSASAVVPLIIRGPAEAIEKVRHFTTSRAFDAHHSQRADKVLDRILAGLDIPKELVAGIADSKYANATVVQESLLTDHVEPMVLQLVDSLTTVFLKPALRSFGWSEKEIDNVVLWYDPSAVATKPSKAEAADRGYSHRTISGKAWRKANGFTEADAPSELEIAQRMAVDKGLLSEPVTEALLRTLIPTLLERVQQQQIQDAGDAGEILEQIDGNEIPAADEILNEDTPQAPDEGLQEGDSPEGLIEP